MKFLWVFTEYIIDGECVFRSFPAKSSGGYCRQSWKTILLIQVYYRRMHDCKYQPVYKIPAAGKHTFFPEAIHMNRIRIASYFRYVMISQISFLVYSNFSKLSFDVYSLYQLFCVPDTLYLPLLHWAEIISHSVLLSL